MIKYIIHPRYIHIRFNSKTNSRYKEYLQKITTFNKTFLYWKNSPETNVGTTKPITQTETLNSVWNTDSKIKMSDLARVF